jgi:hypothetical protein
MLPCVRLLCVLLLLTASAWGADPTSARVLYGDWSVVLITAGSDAGITASAERRIDSMAASGANVIWWTNLPDDPARLAHVVRYARSKGVECVLGSGRWYIGGWNYARTGQPITLPYRHMRLASGERLAWRTGVVDEQFATIQRLRVAMPADAQPLAWSLGDEPPPAALESLRQLADRCQAAGIPTAMVQVPEFHQQTLQTLGNRIPLVSCDVYPFFVPNLPSNPPYGPAALSRAKSTYADVVARSRAAGVRPLMMVQGFGEPGLFAPPSPARVRWQIWSSIAAGSPDVAVFAHGVPWSMADGSPASLVDPRTETLTAAGVAVRDTFARVKSIESLLAGAALESPPAWGSVVQSGDCVARLRTTGGKRLLLVVSDPDATGPRALKVTLPGVASITPLASSTGGTLQALPWPWRLVWPPTLSVSLQPGDAWIGELR